MEEKVTIYIENYCMVKDSSETRRDYLLVPKPLDQAIQDIKQYITDKKIRGPYILLLNGNYVDLKNASDRSQELTLNDNDVFKILPVMAGG
jgi:hypothetical protein